MTLTFDKISKNYGKTKALIDFEATLDPGIYALLGPNGSGKSTLMNILTGNLHPTAGQILFDGENTSKMGKRFREKIGYMPQYPGLYPNFTAEQFLWYMAALKDIPKEKAEKQIDELLTEMELADVRNHPVGSFSGGMKQRLALCQAVLGDPEILILDEPTAGLDPKQRIAFRNFISKIALRKIVIIATHVVSDVEYIAKQAIMLKKGVIVAEDAPSKLTASITDQVWTLDTTEENLPTLRERYRVVGIAGSETGISLRILSAEQPQGAVAVTPTLEDYYLSVFEN